MYLVISAPSTSSSRRLPQLLPAWIGMMPAVLRTVTATRYVTPLREGGSMPGHRGGRRRRAVRPEVPRGGAGHEGARGRAGGRRGRPRARAAGARAGVRGARPGARRGGAGPGDPGADRGQRRVQPRDGLPARARCRSPRSGPRSPSWPPTWCGSTRSCSTSTARPRNPNLLRWHHGLWLIDHGAALYVHHAPGDAVARAGERFPAIRDHVLLPFAGPDPRGRRAAGAGKLDADRLARDRRASCPATGPTRTPTPRT